MAASIEVRQGSGKVFPANDAGREGARGSPPCGLPISAPFFSFFFLSCQTSAERCSVHPSYESYGYPPSVALRAACNSVLSFLFAFFLGLFVFFFSLALTLRRFFLPPGYTRFPGKEVGVSKICKYRVSDKISSGGRIECCQLVEWPPGVHCSVLFFCFRWGAVPRERRCTRLRFSQPARGQVMFSELVRQSRS